VGCAHEQRDEQAGEQRRLEPEHGGERRATAPRIATDHQGGDDEGQRLADNLTGLLLVLFGFTLGIYPGSRPLSGQEAGRPLSP
jgi:hypothetical protein